MISPQSRRADDILMTSEPDMCKKVESIWLSRVTVLVRKWCLVLGLAQCFTCRSNQAGWGQEMKKMRTKNIILEEEKKNQQYST